MLKLLANLLFGKPWIMPCPPSDSARRALVGLDSVPASNSEYQLYLWIKAVYQQNQLILSSQKTQTQGELKMASILDTITADVAAESTEGGSIITLCTNISGQLKALQSVSNLTPEDQAKLTALQTSLETETAAISAAVLANTPSAPTA